MIDISDKIAMGRHAEALIKDELLQAVFEAVGNKYRLAWENSTRVETEVREVAYYSLAALKDVHAHIRAHLGSAKIYESDLQAKRLHEQNKSPY